MAIGNPVAFEASADERETRGFISISTWRPVRGSTANWMFEPPVSTPIARMHASAASRIRWYSRSDSVMHRRDRDRVAGVHAHRVDVLDRADHDGVVRAVAHHLELELLPAGDRLLDEDLGHRARGEAAARDALELGPGASEPAPAAAERERRPDDQRVPELVPELERPVERTRGPRARRLEPGPAHRLLEAAAVLGAVDRLEPRPDQPDPQPLEVAGLRERDRDVQRGLAAERRRAARRAVRARSPPARTRA